MEKDDIIKFDNVMIEQTSFPEEWKNKDALIALLTEKLNAVNKLAEVRKALIEEDFQYKPFLKAACIMILINDEDPERINMEMNQEKLAMCEKHEDVELFFLRVIRASHLNMQGLSDTSETWDWYPKDHLKSMESLVYQKIEKN